MRLAKFLAASGVASRRASEEIVRAGRVTVGGRVIDDPARDVGESDAVAVDGKLVVPVAEREVYALNKPVGVVSTASDPQGRPTVVSLLPAEARLYPVGRLDIDTSGLLLLTNDGDFALRLTHPRYAAEKHYVALVKGQPSQSALQALRNGIQIREDNGRLHTTSPARVQILRQEGANCWLSLVIHEGRKRQVRRMLMAVGHPVLALRREGIGSLALGDVPEGRWRYLTEDELTILRVI